MAKVLNKTKNTVLGDQVEVADSFFSRFCGLMMRSALPEGGGLVLKPCNSIHMFFMQFAIDVAFCNDDHKIVAVLEEIKPWRLSSVYWDATYAVELPAGTLKKAKTEIGDVLHIERGAEK